MDSEERKWLIEVRNDVRWLKKGFSNHLKHHLLYTIAFMSIIGAAIAKTGFPLFLLTKI